MLNGLRTYIAAAAIGLLAAGLACGAGGCVNANANFGDMSYGKSPEKDKAVKQARKKVETVGMDPDRYNISTSSAKGKKNSYWVMFDAKSDDTPRADRHFSVLVDSDGKATIYRGDSK